jgi:hypothetical protein
MLLELGKAGSFFLSILTLYRVAVSAFFVPGSQWQDRLSITLGRLLIAACVSLGSGMIFCWPARSNPDAGQSLISTLPVRLFFWGATALVLFFAAFWYLRCGGPFYGRDCG